MEIPVNAYSYVFFSIILIEKRVLLGMNITTILLIIHYYILIFFSVVKHDNIVKLYLKIDEKVPLTSEISEKSFMFYSLNGNDSLWCFPPGSLSSGCEYHITFDSNFHTKWRLNENGSISIIQKFHVHNQNTVILELLASPVLNDFRILIFIDVLRDKYEVLLENFQNKQNVTLFESKRLNIHNFCPTTEHVLIIDAAELSLLRLVGTKWYSVVTLENPSFKSLKWFSVGSTANFSTWDLFCPISGSFFEKETSFKGIVLSFVYMKYFSIVVL